MAVRPIDGNLLAEKVENAYKLAVADRRTALRYVLDLIADVPTLTPPNDWVSVEERLPPKKQNVLAYSPRSGIAEADYADGVWMQYRWSAVMDDVTHWMPLPEPPERQEDA